MIGPHELAWFYRLLWDEVKGEHARSRPSQPAGTRAQNLPSHRCGRQHVQHASPSKQWKTPQYDPRWCDFQGQTPQNRFRSHASQYAAAPQLCSHMTYLLTRLSSNPRRTFHVSKRGPQTQLPTNKPLPQSEQQSTLCLPTKNSTSTRESFTAVQGISQPVSNS